MRNADSGSEEALRSAKKALRASVIARRDALDAETRNRDSRIITAKLLALPQYLAAGVVCAYASFGSEFDSAAFCSDVVGFRQAAVAAANQPRGAHARIARSRQPGQ